MVTRGAFIALGVVTAIGLAIGASVLVMQHKHETRMVEAAEFGDALLAQFSGQEWPVVKAHLDRQGRAYEPGWGNQPPGTGWRLTVVMDPDAPSHVWYCGSIQIQVDLNFDTSGRLFSAFPTWSSRDCL